MFVRNFSQNKQTCQFQFILQNQISIKVRVNEPRNDQSDIDARYNWGILKKGILRWMGTLSGKSILQFSL